jgi:hypothetical protein
MRDGNADVVVREREGEVTVAVVALLLGIAFMEMGFEGIITLPLAFDDTGRDAAVSPALERATPRFRRVVFGPVWFMSNGALESLNVPNFLSVGEDWDARPGTTVLRGLTTEPVEAHLGNVIVVPLYSLGAAGAAIECKGKRFGIIS